MRGFTIRSASRPAFATFRRRRCESSRPWSEVSRLANSPPSGLRRPRAHRQQPAPSLCAAWARWGLPESAPNRFCRDRMPRRSRCAGRPPSAGWCYARRMPSRSPRFPKTFSSPWRCSRQRPRCCRRRCVARTAGRDGREAVTPSIRGDFRFRARQRGGCRKSQDHGGARVFHHASRPGSGACGSMPTVRHCAGTRRRERGAADPLAHRVSGELSAKMRRARSGCQAIDAADSGYGRPSCIRPRANTANTPASTAARPNQVMAYCRWLFGRFGLSLPGAGRPPGGRGASCST